jgi:hypothetical protein
MRYRPAARMAQGIDTSTWGSVASWARRAIHDSVPAGAAQRLFV